eukprot:gene20092-22062_t
MLFRTAHDLLLAVKKRIYLVLALTTVVIFLSTQIRGYYRQRQVKADMDDVVHVQNIIAGLINGGEEVGFKYYQLMNKYNAMRLSYNYTCPGRNREKTKVNDRKGKFVVVTNFILLSLESYRKNLFITFGLQFNETMLQARITEVVNVLANNLQHPFIDEIHILVKEEEAVDYLRRLPLKNTEKVVINFMQGNTVDMKAQLQYSGHCLKDRIVAISHMDNLFGKGWDKLDAGILRNNHIMYALTRHLAKYIPGCEGLHPAWNCDYPYHGSHDVFMFHVKEELTSRMLKPLDEVTPDLYGMEAVMIWLFKKKLNYSVMNPCLVLYVHHQHCIPIRKSNKRRVNSDDQSADTPFTDKLEPGKNNIWNLWALRRS